VTTNQLVLCRATCQRCGNVEILRLSSALEEASCKKCNARFGQVLIKDKQQPISAERLAEMREAVLKYGPTNCWTGTTGTLAAMVFELLRAIGEERGS